jgi:hypothetical protein
MKGNVSWNIANFKRLHIESICFVCKFEIHFTEWMTNRIFKPLFDGSFVAFYFYK